MDKIKITFGQYSWTIDERSFKIIIYLYLLRNFKKNITKCLYFIFYALARKFNSRFLISNK